MAKKYTVVDAEFHHIPPEAAKRASATTGGEIDFRVRAGGSNPTHRRIFDIEASLRHMEACGLDMVLLGLAPWAEPGLEVCRAINTGLGKLADQYPGKFIPLAHIPCFDGGQSAIDEMERAVSELGLKGVTVVTSQKGIRLDDPLLRPFFQKADRLRVPVVVHPSVKIPIWGGDKYFMSGSVSREYDVIKAFTELLHAVLPQFPDLNILISHYGGGVPFLLGRIMSWYFREDGPVPKERMGFPMTIREFEDYGLKKGFYELLDRVHYNMAGTGGWIPAVKQALLTIKPGRLCFASDYPFEMSRPEDMKAYIAGIKRLAIPEADRVKILGGNIKKLFKV